MNGYKGDYPCDLGCDSDSDISEVSMLVQPQASAKPFSMRSKVKLVVGAGLCEVESLTSSDYSVAVCLPGLRATRQEVTRQRRLAADSAAVEAKPGQLRGRRWGVHQRLVFTRRQRTTAGSLLLLAMPLGACAASCRRFSIAEVLYCSCILNLQVQFSSAPQPALSVCCTTMEYDADAQPPVSTAAELLTTLQERVVALEAQSSSQQVGCVQLCGCIAQAGLY